MIVATLCYIRSGGRTLMLHRNKKEGDVHRGKYNGLGGKLEPGESPDQCVIREVREESGLKLIDARLRGILTFPQFRPGEDWLVFVYTAKRYSGEVGSCSEGTLEWVDDDKLLDLPLWEGDLIFLPWLDQERFFSAKFCYKNGRLDEHEVYYY
jgi:8-oxo-dGTP diphosphatase